MYGLIVIIHLIACITMILIIIFQSSKGAEMGAVFGGGASQTAFGSSGPQSFLEKTTVACAIIFMLTSLSLAYMSIGRTNKLIEGEEAPMEQPVQPAQPPDQPPAQPGQQPTMPEVPNIPPGE
ncbi:MAG: preprotein translocase subunit SecG [bacterium]